MGLRLVLIYMRKRSEPAGLVVSPPWVEKTDAPASITVVH